MDCSIPFKRLSLEVKLQKMLENNTSEFRIKHVQKKIDKLATKQQIAMIKYAAQHRDEEKERKASSF
ncbi:MAG: hypothetical protein J6M60_00505 [Clostridia bacterium]|nr:hypothetical protein [Clostridia bacterium]